jgi:hypothetical protein
MVDSIKSSLERILTSDGVLFCSVAMGAPGNHLWLWERVNGREKDTTPWPAQSREEDEAKHVVTVPKKTVTEPSKSAARSRIPANE